MNIIRRFEKAVCYVVTVGILSLGIQAPVAHAAMVGTEATIQSAQVQVERTQLLDALARQDVQERLVAMGVYPVQVKDRVSALTDSEVTLLSEKMESMPAGGDLGILLFIFIFLIVTDVLGLTNVFPFTNKGSARAR